RAEADLDDGFTYNDADDYRSRRKSTNGLTVLSDETMISEYLGSFKKTLGQGMSIPFNADDTLPLATHHLTDDNLDMWPSSSGPTPLGIDVSPGDNTRAMVPLDLGLPPPTTETGTLSAHGGVSMFGATRAKLSLTRYYYIFMTLKTYFRDVRIGVIGGTGLYSLDGLKFVEEVTVETPWGLPSGAITIAETSDGNRIAFLARHGPAHHVLPSEVNYRANIAALKAVGVQVILAFSAVGSLREEIQPGDFVLIDQIIDRTKGVRGDSFFTGTGVTAHASFGEPVSRALRSLVAQRGDSVPNITVHASGTAVCMEGPAFSTRAESNLYRSWGADVINMTCIPETKLAREAEITYAVVCMATDYDAWRESEESVTVAEVMKTMRVNAANAKALLLAVLPDIEQAVYSDPEMALTKPEAGSMQYAFQQTPDKQSSSGRSVLSFIFSNYF
ncbi:S-methyl-5-thioadenosine phosphorylase, partial [Coemansia sp. S142-1]